MKGCPNVNMPEWKELVQAVGEFEAMKDWMQFEDVRPAILVLDKLNPNREAKIFSKTDKEDNKLMTTEFAQDMMDFLEKKVGLKGQIINDPEQRWKGKLQGVKEDGKVTYIPTINLAYAEISDGFHEYAHIFLAALRKSNSTLFNNIYNELLESPEWKEIKSRAVTKVKSMYPELTGNIRLEDYKEEVLATAIGYASEQAIAGKQEEISSNLKRILDRIFKWLNDFFVDIFSYKLATNKINENTSLSQVIDWMTDTRTKFILDNNWNDVYETQIQFENDGGINVQEPESIEQQIETNLTIDLEQAIVENPKLDMETYISNWLDRTFKLPKKAYTPRKIPRNVVIENTAKSLLKKIGKSFEMTGIELKKDLSQNSEIANKLIQVLTPIEFTYKFANYLDKKANTTISLSQPFAVIKTAMIKDKTGVERKQTTINLPITENEAVVVNEFQKYLKDKNPGKKSMLADEIKAEYLAWVDENYGISWAQAKGHDFSGFGRAIDSSKVKNRTYQRITFADDFYSTSGHSLTVTGTGVVGPGIGWYVNSTINDERYDHEFQSDILPEIRKSYESGAYDSFKEEYIELSEDQKKAKINDLAVSQVYSLIRKSHDRLFASNPYLMDLIRAKGNRYAAINYNIDDDLPFSKIENYNIEELKNAQKLLLSELDVRIDSLISYRMGYLQVLANMKADVKMLQVLTGRKSELKEEVLKFFSTFRIEDEDMPGSPRNTIQTIDPDELPFSKLEGEKYLGTVVKGDKRYKIYATEETYKNIPSFFQEFADQNNVWHDSNSRFKPSGKINAIDIFNSINIPAYFSGDKLKSYPSLVKLRNLRKAGVDKAFNNYRGTKRTIKAYEFRKIVYKDTANILKIAEYFKGQYERYVAFYQDIFQEAEEYAKKKEKLTFEEHPQFKRYRRYNALFEKFFPILIAQSVNSAKMEGRDYYYLPTGTAMELIEGNPAAKNLYLTASETREVISTNQLAQRYIMQNTPESAEVIKRFVGDKLYSYTQETTPLDISVDLADTGFYESKEFNDFAREERAKIPLKKGMMPGPFNVALTTFAKKNNIKLTEERPEWSKAPLIKVDISGYTVKPIERFSRLDPTNEDVNFQKVKFGDEFGKYNGSFRKNVEGVKVLLGSGIISLVKMPEDFQKVEGYTRVSLPKVQAAIKGEIGGAEREVMVATEYMKDEIDKFLTEFDIDYITFHESKNAIWVEIPTSVYEQAKLERRPSYRPSKKQQLAMLNEEANAIPQPKDKGGEQLSMFYREINETPSFTEISEEALPQTEIMINEADVDNDLATNHIKQIADKLSQMLNVPYTIIDEQTAYDLTKDAINPYQGEPAFFYNGQVHFVKGKVRTNMVFHEFSHPLVKAIRLQNPKLFEKLFNDFLKTPESEEVINKVKQFYPDLQSYTEELKEEMLVRAIEQAAMNEQKSVEQSSGFMKFIKDLMVAIKQMFRKMFGQNVSVQTLSPNTTLQDLGKMLVEGGQFELETSNITQNDLVEYYKDHSDYIDALSQIGQRDYKSIQELLDVNAQAILKHLSKLENSQNLQEIANIFRNDFSQSEFAKMKENIKDYSTILNQKLNNMKKDVRFYSASAGALTNTLFKLDFIMDKAYKHLKTLNRNDPGSIHKSFYYKELVTDWKEFIRNAQNIITNNRDIVGRDHPVAALVNKIDTILNDCEEEIRKVEFEGMNLILNVQMNEMKDNIDRRYKEIQEHLEKIGADEKQKKYWKTQYEKVKLDKDTIRKTLEGTMGDANPFNSFLEGYMYNTDPVIGGFARFVYDNITDVLLRAQSKHDAFLAKINPLLEKWGKYNPKKQGELGQLIGFLDKIGLRDTDDFGNTTFKEFEVWSMLGNFRDYRREQSRFKYEIDELKKKEVSEGTDEAHKERVKKQQEYAKFRRDYMHQELIPSFYDRLTLLEKDDIGLELDSRMSDIFNEIGLLYEPSTMQEDVLGTLDKIGKLWRDYNRLGSLTDVRGNKKTGMDYDVAIRMQEYKAASKGLYDFLLKDRAFEDAYEAYRQKLIDTYAKGFNGEIAFLESLEYENYMSKYIAKNTRKVEKKEFWEKRTELLNKISQAAKRGADPRLQEAIEKLQDEMRDMLAGFKDEDNQYIAPEMTPELIAKIKKTEEDIENIRGAISAMKELSGSRMSKEERDQLQAWIEELEDLQVYEPTDYYVDAFNDLIANINSDLLKNFLGTNAVDNETVVSLLNKPVIVKDLMDKSPEFKEWMQKNHFISKRLETVEYTDPETGEILEKKEKRAYYKRIRVWSVVRPRNEKYLETFTFVLNDGTEHTIFGKPSLRFYNRVVKEQFKTGYDFKTGKVNLIVGVHVTNKGNKDFLPRLEDPADRRFINDRYIKLKNAPKGTDDANLYEVLEAIKEYHLENQKGLEVNKKLYLDFPRYRKGFLETLQTTDLFQKKWSAFGVMFRNIADFFRKAKDDPDSGLNPEDQWNLVKADMFNDQTAQIPMTGLYGLDPELVSTNILDSITKYMLSAEKNKKMVELNPYAQALKSILGNDKYKIKDLTKVNKFNFLHRGVITYLNKRGTNVRKQTVENFIEREFQGIQNKGLLSGNSFAQKITSLMFKNASFGFFSLNIPSALKNSLGAKFQGLIQAASGEHFNLKSFIKAEAWSANAMKEISFNVYNRDQKPLVLRVIDAFDVFEGRTAEKMGEGMSRTFLNDVSNLGFLMSFRKWTEMQATLQQYGAMMMDKKIMQNGKEISYMDAWEVRDGRLQLKAGIDPTWGISYDDQGNIIMGQEFKNFRSTVHAVIRDLNGAYDQFNQPEAGRYLLYRYFGFLRKYFTTMLVNRYGFAGSLTDPTPRRNPGFNDVREGFYITTIRWLGRTIKNIHQTMPYALPHEKIALRKMATEMGTLLGIMMLLGPLFGWDPDDEERYEKLREKSGAMPFLGMTDEDSGYPFHMSGFLSNHALNLMMQVRAENEQFLPLPGFGLDDFGTYLDIKSIAAGPTLIKYGKILTDLSYLVSEDQRGFYQREVGPYEWQQEESAKIWNHLLGTIGLTGSSVDPSVTIKNFQSIQSRQ